MVVRYITNMKSQLTSMIKKCHVTMGPQPTSMIKKRDVTNTGPNRPFRCLDDFFYFFVILLNVFATCFATNVCTRESADILGDIVMFVILIDWEFFSLGRAQTSWGWPASCRTTRRTRSTCLSTCSRTSSSSRSSTKRSSTMGIILCEASAGLSLCQCKDFGYI